MEFGELLNQWAALVGVAALIAVLINVMKLVGVVKDGQAPTWSAGLNLAGLIALLVLKVVKPEFDPGEVDQQAGTLAEIGVLITGFVLQLLASKATHAAVKGVPVIGTSFETTKDTKNTKDTENLEIGKDAHREQMIIKTLPRRKPWIR